MRVTSLLDDPACFVLTKSSENRPAVDPVDDGDPALQVHRQARDGEVDDQLVRRGPQDSVSGTKLFILQ